MPAAAPEDLRIGDLSRATGKTARALRLYEEMGLLSPGHRSAGGFRLYDSEAIKRVQWIGALQDLGLTLADVQALVSGAASETVPREAMLGVRALFVDKLEEISGQIARLSDLRRSLSGAIAYLDECTGCAQEAAGVNACTTCSTHDDAPPPLLEGVGAAARERANKAPEEER